MAAADVPAAASTGAAAPAALTPFLPTRFFWYDCDGAGDSGWGCGYRVVQTLLSAAQPAGTAIPTFPETLAMFGAAPGVYADVGDIALLFLNRFGWGAKMLQCAVR